MTFEEYRIKFSRRNIKEYSNDSDYSDVSRKKGRRVQDHFPCDLHDDVENLGNGREDDTASDMEIKI